MLNSKAAHRLVAPADLRSTEIRKHAQLRVAKERYLAKEKVVLVEEEGQETKNRTQPRVLRL
jgi:hypothetical protein